jgi:hypothetical protein
LEFQSWSQSERFTFARAKSADVCYQSQDFMARIAGYFPVFFVRVFRWRGVGSLGLQILSVFRRVHSMDLWGVGGAVREVGEPLFAGHGDPGIEAFFEKLEDQLSGGSGLDWLDRVKRGAIA